MKTWGFTVLRVVAGTVFLMHGWQRLTMMGFDGVAGFFGSLGIPAAGIAVVVVTLVELIGGAALILGVLTRWISIPLAATMAVAISVDAWLFGRSTQSQAQQSTFGAAAD